MVAERRGRITAADSQRFVDLLARLPIRTVPDSPDRVLNGCVALARAQQLTVYDASYLDLAVREGAPIATLDERVREAAGRLGVALWRPA